MLDHMILTVSNVEGEGDHPEKQRRTPPAKQSGLVAWCRSVNAC